MIDQLTCLLYEIRRAVNHRYWRLFTMWFGGAIYVNVSYRIDRMLFLLFQRAYPVVRPVFFPLFLLCHILGGRHEISYRADLGPGLRILQSALGLVVNGKTVAGPRLTLTGGNLIGGRRVISEGDIAIGSDVTLGANAVVLGPVRIGNQCKIGAGAVVISDFPDNSVLVGVPARNIKDSPPASGAGPAKPRDQS